MTDTTNPVVEPTTGSAVAPLIDKLPTLKQFDSNAPAEFGNAYLESLLKSTAFDEELQQAIDTGEQVKKFIHFELTKAVMSASEKGKDINLYKVFEGAKEVERLNSKVLQYFGVITKEIKDDDVITKWSSEPLAKEYDYGSIDKEKDEKEHTRRFNNRKRLNLRLSEAYKVACALMDGGTKAEQLKLVENADTKQVEPVIENAPDFLRGDKAKNGSTITFGKRAPNEGSTVAPNIASLVKAASLAHKKAEDTGIPGERADVGAERSGDAKLGMSDEDFGAIVNNLRRAIMAQEGQLSADMIKQLGALVPYIDEQIKITLSAPKQESLEDLSDDEPVDNEDEDLTDVTEGDDAVVEEVVQNTSGGKKSR